MPTFSVSGRGLIVVFLAIISLTARGEEKKRFGFERARIIIVKSVSNPQIETTTIDTVYFDRAGLVEVRHSFEIQDVKMLNKKTESRTVSIVKDGWITTYDPETKKGKRFKSPVSEALGSMSEGEQQQFAKGMESAFKAKTTAVGTEEVAGKLCDVTETRTGLQGMESVSKLWMWKGFVVKSVTDAMGTRMTETATSIDESFGVTEKLLRIPDGVDIQNIGTP